MPDHFPIKIDANRAVEEPFRIKRLELLQQIIEYHADLFFAVEKLESASIIGLYDSKGCLVVNWDMTPEEDQTDTLEGFWEAVFFEPLVDHFVCGVQLTHNDGFRSSPFAR